MPTRRGAKHREGDILRVLLIGTPGAFGDPKALLRRCGFSPLFSHAPSARVLRRQLGRQDADLMLADAEAGDLIELALREAAGIPLIVMGLEDESAAVSLLEHGAVDCLRRGQEKRLPFAARRALDFRRECDDRRRAELALRRALDHSREARRMELIGRLANGVAHDLNNLLTGVFGYCDLIAESLDEQDAQRADVDGVRELGKRGMALVEHLMAFARKRDADPVAVDVNAALARLSSVLGRLLGERIEVQVRCSPQEAWIYAEEGALEECLVSLIVDARDAMPQGGRLVLSARTSVRAPRAVSARGAWVEIEAAVTRITAELPRVKAAVQRAGGVLALVRQRQGGGVIRMLLPARPRGISPRLQASAQPPRGAGESVLLVEDDARLLRLIAGVLSSAGYQVSLAADATAALSQIGRDRTEPALLLSDVILPGVSGLDLARRLRQVHPRAALVLTSGYGRMDSSNGLPEGAVFLPKPFTPADLLSTVRQALDARSKMLLPGV